MSEDGRPAIDGGLAGVALAIAPLVFVVVAFVSANPEAPKQVLRAMGLLLVLGLAVGTLAPVLGAAAGFATGTAITLRRPDIPGVLGVRLWAVGFALAYTLLLLAIATPAGVMTGAILPMVMVGMADEYARWRRQRDTPAADAD